MEALKDLYKDLNSDFLKDLEAYTQENYSIGLFDLIDKTPEDPELLEGIQALKEDNSISCMEDYYQLIDYMFETMEAT
jgi:hypothetical protein